MASLPKGQISFTFLELRELLASFEEHRSGEPRSSEHKETIYQLVDHIGSLAVPTLLRQLFGSPSDAKWAVELLTRLADSEARCERIARALQAELEASIVPEACRFAVAELLGYLGVPVPWPEFVSAEDSAQHSLCDLASCIDSPAELARAADTLLADLPVCEVVEFVEDFASQEPGIALMLIDELLLRDSLTERTRSQLRQLGVSASIESRTLSLPHPKMRDDANRPGLRIASHGSGRSALVAYAAAQPTRGQRLYRGLCLHLDAAGCLQDCEYLEQVPRNTIESLIIRPLVEAGYELSPITPGTLRQHAISATQLRARAGRSIPRAYYLGRDLMGLRGEHMPTRSAHAERRSQDAALLARGTELLSRGKAQVAKELLLQYAKGHPNDSEALATLGSCLVKTGDVALARQYLARASQLSPHIGRYHWNQAALAHQEGRMGDCYLSLQAYLRCDDTRAGGQSHTHAARELVASYGLHSRTVASNDERRDNDSAPGPGPRRK